MLRVLSAALAFVVCMLPFATGVQAKTSQPPQYLEALELIHSYGGSGNELHRAMAIADLLASGHPNSGLAQALQAEAVSTWQLDATGGPDAFREIALHLIAESLRLNPMLAQPHVARARIFYRIAEYERAQLSVNAALSADPGLHGAFFLQAQLHQKANRIEQAELWYQKFIAATHNPKRKSNALSAIGAMYTELVLQPQNPGRSRHVEKARQAYLRSVELDPKAPWKLVSAAAFMNGPGQDFEHAERLATAALAQMQFPMARYQLAAARFQRIWARAGSSSLTALKDEVETVSLALQVSLAEAIDSDVLPLEAVKHLLALSERLNGHLSEPPSERLNVRISGQGSAPD